MVLCQLFYKYLNFIICGVVAKRVCWLVLCSDILEGLASCIIHHLGGVATCMLNNYRSGSSWVPFLSLLNILNFFFYAHQGWALGPGGAVQNEPYNNPLPRLPRPGRVYHLFFLLYTFLMLLLFHYKPSFYYIFLCHAVCSMYVYHTIKHSMCKKSKIPHKLL